MYINSISALMANQSVNFQRKSTHTPMIKSLPTPVVTEPFETVIPDILSYSKSFSQASSGAKNQNPAFTVNIKPDTPNSSVLNYDVIVGSSNVPAVTIDKNKNVKNLPAAQFKVGKFGPTVELIDKEIGIKVQMIADSAAQMNGLKIALPKLNGMSKFGINNLQRFDVTFNGRTNATAKSGGGEVQVVTFYKEEATKDAVDSYINDKGKLYNKVAKGDFIKELQENKPNVMILAGGFGTRLFNLTGADSNKPALKLPTRNSYRLMANALDLASKSGMITDAIKGTNTNLVYLSGKGSIKGDNVRDVIQQVNLGDGGCIAKALYNDKTATDAPLIILNADTFTNADITRAYKAFLDHPDAALLIPYYEASVERAKGFGLMAIDKSASSENGVYPIKSFVEKTPNPCVDASSSIVEGTLETGNPKFMANPGIYIISPAALRRLRDMGKDIDFELGLAKNFVTPLVRDCMEGKFLDENGNPMKCYTAKLEKKGGGAAYWDDLGLDVAIPQTFRDMAKETKATSATSSKNKYFGMPSFLLKDAVKNTDLKTGLVFMNEDAKDKYAQFVKKYPGFQAKGNVIVYDSVK